MDISERKKIEEKLVKSERLASIGELSGQIGHDLRNPLAAIKNGIYIIKKKDTQLERAKREEIFGFIENSIEDSNRIITSLVDYSDELNLQLEQCTPNSLVLHVLSKIQVPGRLNIINNTKDDIIFLDLEKMEKVFASLIKNSIDATPEEGTIQIQSTLKESNIEISFTDSGLGIPENILPKLFAPLVTTKAKGMGMSLAVCKRIVEAHGGKIGVESAVGKGTTFTISLPVKQSKSEFTQVQMFTGIEKKQATIL
jgi:signal transduction histidine kinase